VAGAGREPEQERPVAVDGAQVVQELDGVVGEVLGEVVALLGPAGRIDLVAVVDEVGVVLVGLGAEEAVEALEAAARAATGGGGRPSWSRAPA
jgi:hypothetical protein